LLSAALLRAGRQPPAPEREKAIEAAKC
jgi:hypothetical protein